MPDDGYGEEIDEALAVAAADLAEAYPCTLDEARRVLVSALNGMMRNPRAGDTDE